MKTRTRTIISLVVITIIALGAAISNSLRDQDLSAGNKVESASSTDNATPYSYEYSSHLIFLGDSNGRDITALEINTNRPKIITEAQINSYVVPLLQELGDLEAGYKGHEQRTTINMDVFPGPQLIHWIVQENNEPNQ